METYWFYAYLTVGVVFFILFCRYVVDDEPDIGDYVISPFVILLWFPLLAVISLFIVAKMAVKLSKIGVKK